jgi:hypothetical protein
MFASLLIAHKDLQSLLRDPMALFWVVAFPLGFALFFGSVMKAGVDAQTAALPVVLVLESHEPAAKLISSSLARAGLRLSQASRAQAEETVRRGDAVAFVRLAADPDAPIELGVDPSRRAETALLTGLVKAALMPPTRFPEFQTTRVAREQSGPRTGFEIMFPAMLMWGLFGCAATFAISLVSERNAGTLMRLRAAPVSRSAILFGKSLACAVACLGDVILLSALAVVFWKVRIDDATKYCAALLACTLCFTGITMALSVIGKSEQGVAGAGWATLLVFAMVGGAMVPISVMPSWMVTLSDASPVKWGILALEGATWRGLFWRELLKPLALLIGFGVLCFAGGVAVLRAWREV